MKRFKIFKEWNFHFLKKTFRIMRITIFIILTALLQAFATETYSQKTKLSLDFNSAKLTDVLDEIENLTEFFFLFNEKLVDTHRRVTISARDEKIEEILKELFAGTDVVYTITDRKIILAPEYLSESQQQKTVSGKVTDKSGAPLPGVTVLVKGTTQGTVTNADGNYSLSNIPEDATLVFSFVGMKTQEIAVGNQTSVNIAMEIEAIGIDEVVAIGYGTMKKRDLTGSVAKVNIQKMEEIPNIGIMESMQGSVAGLNIGAVDAAGESPVVSIRGQNTLSSSANDNAPLIVLDGVIFRGRLIDINTRDIESVEILKDASSAAIYGSQASNGVILVTTKKGIDTGKPAFTYSTYKTFQVPSNKLRPLNGAEREDFLYDVFWYENRLGPDYLQPNPNWKISNVFKTLDINEGYENGADNDWWGLLTRNGKINAHNLSIGGQNQSLSYYMSVGLTEQEGFMLNDDFKKNNVRINLDAKITDFLKVGGESFFALSDYSGQSPSITEAFVTEPYAPMYDDNGNYYLKPGGNLNPFLVTQNPDYDKNMTLFGTIHSDLQLPFLKGFNYRINYSHNYQLDQRYNFNPYGANFTGAGYKNYSSSYNWSFDNIVTYKKTFKNDHKLDLTLLYGVEEFTTNFTNSSSSKFSVMTLGYNKLEAGDPSQNVLDSGASEETSIYSMARVFYSYKGKYMLTGTVRRDGFSGFGADRKIGVFPSVASAWVVSDERFIKDNLKWFNYLKLRASYGESGRRALTRYQTLAKLNVEPTYVFGEGGPTSMGQWVAGMANNDLGWETTTGLNLGLDFAIINSRLSGTVEYYSNDTRDILYNIALPNLTGFSAISTNIGKVHNHGLEFSLTGKVINTSSFKWESSINFSRNRNRIVSILGADNDGDGKEDDLISSNLFIGEPQQVIYQWNIIGMWQLADQQAGVIPVSFLPGTYKIEDYNGDGNYSSADRKILGYVDPSYRFGLSNEFKFKNFSLYVFVNSIQGGKNYYMADGSPHQGQQSLYEKAGQLSYNNAPQPWDYWMPENPDAKYRRLDTPSGFQVIPYDQRSFVRLQDISLSYTFNKELLSRLKILESLKVYVSGKNLKTWTKWEGWDPETGLGYRPGVPVMTSYTMGIDVEF